MADQITSWDLQLGTLLLASWANFGLFTLELIESYRYFDNANDDGWLIKGSIVIAILADTATVLANAAACYLYQVTHFTSRAFAVSQPWPMSTYVVGTGISALVTQIFLTSRIVRLSNRWWLLLFIPCVSSGFIGTIGTTIGLKDADTLDKRHQLANWIVLWLAGSAGTDITLSAVLIWLLRGIKSDFVETGNVVQRISIASLRNGSFTAGLALGSLVLFEVSPDTNLDVMLTIILGRVATLTYLSNLNGRQSLRGSSGAKSSSGHKDDHHHNGGVAVSKHVVTRYEEEADEESEIGIELQKSKSSYSANPGEEEQASTLEAVEPTWTDVSPWDSRSKVASNSALV